MDLQGNFLNSLHSAWLFHLISFDLLYYITYHHSLEWYDSRPHPPNVSWSLHLGSAPNYSQLRCKRDCVFAGTATKWYAYFWHYFAIDIVWEVKIRNHWSRFISILKSCFYLIYAYILWHKYIFLENFTHYFTY